MKKKVSKKTKQDISYQPDRPIKSQSEDRFGRWSFAERIADTIGSSKDPSSLVIGIYSEWGDGKTSALNLMESALGKYDDVILVKFNPWYFQSEPQLIKGFFETLANTLKKSLSTKVKKLGSTLQVIGSIASLASASVLGGAVSIDPGQGISKLGEKLSETDLDSLKERVETILKESGKRIVVLIDDIDRLDKEEIQAVFKLVKLSANFEQVTYVLAFDEEMVALALSEKYGGINAGRKFIEKIIQVPLHLPAADPIALRKFTFEGVDTSLSLSKIELNEEDTQIFVNEFIHGLEHRVRTPRQAKRYGNALTFALPILKGEVNIVDQMLIESLRILYPKLYETIRENPDIFMGEGIMSSKEEITKRGKELFDKSLEDLGLLPNEKEGASHLLSRLFPRFNAHGSYGNDWDKIWNREKKVCSQHYFQRYFNYSVPPGDVSDKELESFLLNLDEQSDTDANKTFNNLAKSGGNDMARFVEKLRYREDLVPLSSVEKLTLIIAGNGKIFSDRDGSFLSILDQAAIFVSNLIGRISSSKSRESISEKIIAKAETLSFGIEFFRWARHSKEDSPEKRKLSDVAEKKIGKLLVKRIKEITATDAVYNAYPAYTSRVLWIWNEFGPKNEARSYLISRFKKTPKEVVDFLISLTPTAYGGGRAAPHKSDFRFDSYKIVEETIDPKIIFNHLKKIYGKKLNYSTFNFPDDLELGNRVANQFAFHYSRSLIKTPESE